MKRTAGFSIVELMVAVAILGIALAAVMPSIVGWTRDLAVRGAAESIKTGLDKARVEALRRNSVMGFWLVADGENKTLTATCALSDAGPSWVVAGLNPSGACDAAPSRTEAPRLVDRWVSAQDGRNIRLTTLTRGGAQGDRVEFDNLGQLLAGDEQVLRIDVDHAEGVERPLRVEVGAGGVIRLCDPKVTAATDPRICRGLNQ